MSYLSQLGIQSDDTIDILMTNNRIADSSLKIVTPQKHFSKIMFLMMRYVSRNVHLLEALSAQIVKTWLR